MNDENNVVDAEEQATEEVAATEEPVAVQSTEPAPIEKVEVSINSLLTAGAHFGHQTHRWHPKMAKYIYGERNGVHIINLDITLKHWERARKYITDVSARGGNVLFVSTKQQSRDVVKEAAASCGAYSATTRWLGGTLSNFQTVKHSIDRMAKLEDLLTKADDVDSDVKLHKKEKLQITRQLEKLNNNLDGIRAMKKPPEIMFVIDINKEFNAVTEARKLNIPVIALVDTNVDPDFIDFPIPSNDDAIRTIKLFSYAIANAISEGKSAYSAMATRKMSDIVVKARKSGSNGAKKEEKEVEAEVAVTEETPAQA